MTPKELLYIEDALGHETEMKTSCQDLANQIQDADLKAFVQGLANKHNQCFSQFYTLINN